MLRIGILVPTVVLIVALRPVQSKAMYGKNYFSHFWNTAAIHKLDRQWVVYILLELLKLFVGKQSKIFCLSCFNYINNFFWAGLVSHSLGSRSGVLFRIYAVMVLVNFLPWYHPLSWPLFSERKFSESVKSHEILRCKFCFVDHEEVLRCIESSVMFLLKLVVEFHGSRLVDAIHPMWRLILGLFWNFRISSGNRCPVAYKCRPDSFFGLSILSLIRIWACSCGESGSGINNMQDKFVV